MTENAITLSPGIYIFSIITSLVAVVILAGVLKVQLDQFKIKSDLQGMKVFLTVMIVSLLLANLITLTLALLYIGKPIPAEAIAVSGTVNRFNAVITTIALGLVYRFQIRDNKKD